MRTVEQHPFFLRLNKGILEAHTSEDEYMVPVKPWYIQLINLLFWGE